MTASSLRNCTIKDLARMAKRRGVNGWHSMRKDQLVRAILRSASVRSGKAKPAQAKVAKKIATPVRRLGSAKNGVAAAHGAASLQHSVNGSVNGRSANGHSANGRSAAQRLAQRARITRRIEQAKQSLTRSKNLAFVQSETAGSGPAKNRLVVMVRGPFWLHAYWELTPQGIARAQAALGQDWHQARPVLRVLLVTSRSATTTSERLVREIPIHGGVRNWYVDVQDSPRTYRLEIGYLASGGKFYSLARSNVVTTPAASATDSLDAHWQDVLPDCDKIYSMSGGFATEGSTELQELFEERLRRPMVANGNNPLASAVDGLMNHNHGLRFQVEAEMVIHGVTRSDARVTLQGEPLKLRPDGSFSVRLDLPNRRQVIPLVAATKDGIEQRTIVLAVERNTKVMEPLTREAGE